MQTRLSFLTRFSARALARIALIGVLALPSPLVGCKRARTSSGPSTLREAPRPKFPSSAVLRERSGQGRIAYLGFDLSPESPARGDSVEMTHYLRVDVPLAGDYDLFVHGEAPGKSERVLVDDHAPAGGREPTSRWKAGEIWIDRHRITIPSDLASGAIEIYTGLFKGDTRLTVEAPPGESDGKDRIRAGVLSIGGERPAASQGSAKDDLPEVVVHRTSGSFVADGVLDEPDWAKAEVLAFSDSMGRNVAIRYPTRLRLLYDESNLYLGFEASDTDITERYAKRDDPIYEHEAVEIFLMPHVAAPQLGPYIELQASPGGVIFDAAFTGRRQGMDVGFNGGQTVGTRIDGTLNQSGDVDRGWVSEWIVPWTSLRGVETPPKAGDEWRANAFRIEKYGSAGAPGSEYTAWSPPQVGDFHNTARFGRMKFGR